MSNIYTRQNEEGSLGLLKLQRIIYSKAKKLQFVYATCAIFVSVLFLVLTSVINSVILWNISIFTALLVFLSGWLVDVCVSRLKDTAAGIQQRFDIYVLGVPISYMGLTVPNSGVVAKFGIKYKSRVVKNLENWYSDYSGFEEERQVLFCQRENVNWDKPLRWKLLWTVIVLLIIGIITIITLGIIADDLHLTFCIFSWLVPYFGFRLKIILNLYRDIKRLEILESELKNVESIDKNLIRNKISETQRLIWEHRKSCYLIPECFYNINRKEQQEIEDLLAKGTREKVDKSRRN